MRSGASPLRGVPAQSRGEPDVLDDRELRLGVGDTPCEIVRVVVDVQGDDDQREPERREVDRDPRGAVARGEGDAVAGNESLAPERGLPARDVRLELGDGHVAPAVVGRVPVEHGARRRPVTGEELSDIAGHASGSGLGYTCPAEARADGHDHDREEASPVAQEGEGGGAADRRRPGRALRSRAANGAATTSSSSAPV